MNSDTSTRDLMHREFPGVSESDTLDEAAALLVSESADCLVVVRGEEPVGCLSLRDALAAVIDGSDPATTTVEDAMSRSTPTIDAGEPIDVAEERLVAEGTSRLIVTDGERAVGLLTEHDVLAARPAQRLEEANAGAGTNGARRTSASEPAAERATAEEPTQSICEVCGSLAATLETHNGQLVCADCQEV
ncbi:CBS domain-containing protein [Halopenitus sp. POP-27]|uniref:CBS domain-containing protein n=1 Tax=Halopenitus sp. POP-27 TaxID=2994425 RepID=UPI0024699888|nr:CBS domain-containing protein [Halopenitus sp. POP-27]